MGKNYTNAANELWTMLAEKAYVQANQFGWIRPGLPGNGQNSYSGIEGGYIYAALGHVTGQATIAVHVHLARRRASRPLSAPGTPASRSASPRSRRTPSGSGVVGSHAYAVIGYNATQPDRHALQPVGPELRHTDPDLDPDPSQLLVLRSHGLINRQRSFSFHPTA